MFAILGGKVPSKKISARLGYEDLTATYVATKTREIINIYRGEDLVGSIYISLRMIRELNVQSDSVDVYGEWEDFKWLIDGKDRPEGFNIEWDEKALGAANRVKGLEYIKLDDVDTVNSISQLSTEMGERVEDILYRNVSLNVLREDNDLSWADNKNYRILTEDEDIYEFIEGLAATTEVVGFDTETTGLEANRTKSDKLVGVVMSYEDDSGVYFPVLHDRFGNVKMGQDKLLELLKPYCDRNSPKAKDLVAHNGGFDWRVMKMHDWDLNIVHDTLILQSLHDAATAKRVRALKDIMKYRFKIDVVELDDMYESINKTVIDKVRRMVDTGAVEINSITKRKLQYAQKQNDLLDFRFASREFVELYGPADGDFPRMLYKEIMKEWDKALDFVYRIEIALIPVLGEQEYYGVRAVQEGFERLAVEEREKLNNLEAAIYKEAGTVFNIRSTPQKSDVLFNKIGIPKKDKYKSKKTGQYGTGKKVLEDLERYKNNDGTPRYPIVKNLMAHSKSQKLLDSFYEKLPLMIRGGFLFSGYNQVGAETGRLSSSRPNLQQTEGTSRQYMVTDTDEHYFLICDYSQVEYRIMAGLAGEKKVVDFFTNDPEADYHILAYANMVGKPYEDVTPEERGTGKVLNFGTTYGLEDASLALNLYGTDSVFAQKKANNARKEYFDGIPDIRDYFEEIRDQAERDGYAETLFGRRRYIPEFRNGVNGLSDFRRGSGRRKAGNHPVQGTAADIQKMSMIRVHRALREQGWDESMARLVMNIHDELVIQFHKSISKWYALKVVREAMEMDLSVHGLPPLYIGANLGYSWGDGVDELEAPVYLMNEKVAEVDKLLAEGKELPVSDDPRQEWIDEINEFKLKVVEEEWNKGYTDKGTGQDLPIKDFLDALKNPRLMKYSHHFGKVSNAVIFEVAEKGYKQVFSELDKVNNYESDMVEKLLRKISKGITDNNITKVEDVSKVRSILNDINYFGKYSWTVLNVLMERDVEEVIVNMKELVWDTEPIDLEVKESVEGEDITEKQDTVKEYVKKNLIKYNKRLNKVTVILENDEMEFLDIIESMLVPVTSLREFKDDEKHVLFSWKLNEDTAFDVEGYVLFRKFLVIVGDMLVRNVTGAGYDGVKERVEEIGSTLVK